MIKILIADDHTMFVDGIASILKLESDMEVVATASTGVEIFQIIDNQDIDLILLDVNLPDTTGIEVSKRLNQERPDLKILVISMFNQESYVTEILKYGALGYILKNTDKTELLKAIRMVYSGKSYFSKKVTDTIVQSLMKNQESQPSSKGFIPKISRREQEVLALIAEEYTTQEIADKLFINNKTVESHRRSLLVKFGARNSVGLIRTALEKGLL